MIYGIELFVRLKTVDLSALTAKNTLQRDMGYSRVLKDLKREDYWLILVDCRSEDEATELATEFTNKTKIFVNPNKHTYTIRIKKLCERFIEEKREVESGLYEIKVLVVYDGDSKASLTKDTLCRTLGYGDRVKDVETGVIWSLLIDAEDEEKAKEVALDIVVTKDVKRGLLVNPHSQSYRIL